MTAHIDARDVERCATPRAGVSWGESNDRPNCPVRREMLMSRVVQGGMVQGAARSMGDGGTMASSRGERTSYV